MKFSSISDKFFALPPRSTTMKNKIHGLHYLKMFPVANKYLLKFHISNDPYYTLIYTIINRKLKTIIGEAQKYLDDYQKGNIQEFATNISAIYLSLQGIVSLQEAAIGMEDIQKVIKKEAP